MSNNLIFIKPIWVLLIYIGIFLLGGIFNTIDALRFGSLGIVLIVPAVIFQMYWSLCLCIYFSTSLKKNNVIWVTIIFYMGVVGYFLMSLTLISGLFGILQGMDNILSTALPLGMVIGNLSVFVLIVIAAYALEKAEKGDNATLLNIIGSAFLIFYFPIGIWFIAPRLRKLRSL